jgi:hypothetical protein
VTGFQKNVLRYLREVFEDDPDCSIESTEEIAEALGKKPLQLYNYNTDSGPLYHLWKEGLISRYGDRKEGFKWQASGASVVWDRF